MSQPAVQLTWATWPEVCEFVPRPWFDRGVFLDDDGFPKPNKYWDLRDDSIGLIIRNQKSKEVLIARANTWISRKPNGDFRVTLEPPSDETQ